MKRIFPIILLILLLAGCSAKENVELSIQKGLIYLDSAYTEEHSYEDGYLEYVYPAERLECPLNGSNLTYRILDAYFNLMFIEEQLDDYSIIEEQVVYANTTINAIIPLWERDRIYNVIKDPEQGGYALDTYCILGLITNNSKMASNVRGHIQADHWMPKDFYTGDEYFRRVADESWCIRLLARQGEPIRYLRELTRVQRREVDAILEGDYTPFAKVNALIHIMYVFNEIDNEEFDEHSRYYRKRLVDMATNKKIQEDTLTMANILEVLIDSGYKKTNHLNMIARTIVERQQPDGKWYPSIREEEDFAQVFTTFRCIIALDKYNKYVEA